MGCICGDGNTDDGVGAQDGEREPVGRQRGHVPAAGEVHDLLRLGGAERVDLVRILAVDAVVCAPAERAHGEEVCDGDGDGQGREVGDGHGERCLDASMPPTLGLYTHIR
jgi:hypothetical protein